MKLLFFIGLICLSFSCFSQSKGLNAIKQITNNLTAEPVKQDKPATSGTPSGQTNLAVSDPGSSSGKTNNANKTAIETPADSTKKSSPGSAVKSPNTSGSSNNLAVSDPGSDGKGKTKTSNKEASGGNTNQEVSPVKETSIPPSPK